MTFNATGPTHHDGIDGGFALVIDSHNAVADLVALLTKDESGTAHIENEPGAFVAHAHVEHGFGYLFYVDDTHDAAFSVGEPDSPSVASDEQTFPTGSGLGGTEFEAALHQLLDTDTRPTVVRWRRLP